MNLIYYNDDKMQVSYIQGYLKDKFTNYLNLNGIYNIDTHHTLKEYLTSTYTSVPSEIGKTLINWYDEDNIYSGYRIDEATGNIVTDNSRDYLISISKIYSETKFSIIHENYRGSITVGIMSIDPEISQLGILGRTVQDIKTLNFSIDNITSDYLGRKYIEDIGVISHYLEFTTSTTEYNPDYDNYLVIQFKSSSKTNEDNSQRTPDTQLSFSRSFMVIPGELYVVSPLTNERISNIQLDHIIKLNDLLSVPNVLKSDYCKQWGFTVDNLVSQNYYVPLYSLHDSEVYWSASEYLLPYLNGTAITELSDREDILYFQYLVSLIDPEKDVLSGSFGGQLPYSMYRQIVQKFQIESRLSSSGCIDPITEKRIRDLYLEYSTPDLTEVISYA